MILLRQVNFDLSPDEVVASGHQGCAGCGAALGMRLALKTLGRATVLVAPHGCWSIIDGPWPYSAAGVPLMHTPSTATAGAASGVRAALDLKGNQDATVCALINGDEQSELLPALSSAVGRGERILFLRCDTQADLPARGHNFGAAPGASPVSTNAGPVSQSDQDLLMALPRLGLAYAATATVAFPDDFTAKLVKARRARGTTFLHVLTPCPPAWEVPSFRAIRATRMAVLARVFPLVEIEHGRPLRLTVDPGHVPLEDYLREQGRFRRLLEDPEALDATRLALEQRWQHIVAATN